MQQFKQKLKRGWYAFMSTYVCFIYIAIAITLIYNKSNALRNWEVLLFGFGSMSFKVLLHLFVKVIILKRPRIPSHVVFAIHTSFNVFIDTQIRLTISQLGSIDKVTEVTFALMLAELLSRFCGLYAIKLNIRAQVFCQKGETTENYKRRALRMHAANVYAAMLSEYTGIVTSVLVSAFLAPNDLFDLTLQQSSASEIVYVILFQFAAEMMTDIISISVEMENEVPLIEYFQKEGSFTTALYLYLVIGSANLFLVSMMFLA